jgi:hypothetical protein
MQTAAESGFERWQAGLKKGADDPKWSIYDCEIKAACGGFNRHLAKTPNYRTLDWRLIKAMLWVETGAASAEWKTRPMQIGVPGDPGLKALLSNEEGGELILDATWKSRLTPSTVSTFPVHNIHAGIAYLLMRLAMFEYKSVVDPRSKGPFNVTVQAGDSLAKIAKKHGSTIDILKRLNGPSDIVKPGQILKVEKGSVMRVISGWRMISTGIIAQRYNGGGDPLYARKLDYAFNLVKNAKEGTCQ